MTAEDKAKQCRDDNLWNCTFLRLVLYKEQCVKTTVPLSYNDGKEPHLGKWANNQRKHYKEFVRTGGKAGAMTQQRIDMLNSIGFVWDHEKDRWNDMFDRLCQYKSKNGNTNVPQIYDKDPELGFWVNNQRIAYRQQRLSPERIQRLESIGFEWSRR